jgi:mono/diheme cytochrome c family protein
MSSSTGKRVGIVIGIIVVIGLLVLAWELLRPGPLDFVDGQRVALNEFGAGKVTGVPADFTESDPIAIGKYLAEAADCEACHTVDGGQPFAGGRPFKTEFGTLYSPNITPDPETGIGNWTDEDFLRAMHEGVSKDGTHLYPAFPYPSYTYLTEEDVLAIKAYIFSLTPVKNTPPEHELGFPYNQRGLMSLWAKMYNPNERFKPVADRSASWNRGAYLAEALGHCGDCHTPRTALQALDNRNKFAGGFAEGWRAFNITSDKDSGIGDWSAEDLETYLKTGHSQDYGSAFGPMALAVHLSFQKLTPSDVSALVEYVRTIPPQSTPDMPTPKREPAPAKPSDGVPAGVDPRGAEIYAGMCSGCHGWTGKNTYVPFTTFTGNRAVNDPTATNVALAVIHGANPLLPDSGQIATMPSFGHILSDADIAAVSNYVIARFGAKPSKITAQDVKRLREEAG